MPKSTKYEAKVPDRHGLIHYSDEENKVWADLYAAQIGMVQKYCASEYIDGLRLLDLPSDRVPQCKDLSDRLLEMTGWRVVPVPALIGFQSFFGMLAERQFPAASFIRSREDFEYIEEPDIFHEIFGHTPLLTDKRFADFSQAIGQAGTRADSKSYSWLIRLYWFTIEFGLKMERGTHKALGSGLASSPTELKHAILEEAVERRPFNVTDILRTPYRIDIPQPIYYVLDDLDMLFACANRDLLADVAEAQSLGLFAPTYPPKDAAA